MRPFRYIPALCAAVVLGVFAASASADTFSGPGGPLVDSDGTDEGLALFTINVSGTGATVASLDAITLTGFEHTFIGDLVIGLIAPDGAFVTATSPPATHSSNLDGTYTFVVSNILPTWDEITDGTTDSFVVPSGSYAASDWGAGDLGPRVDWAEMQGAALDGNWSLGVWDFAAGDSGQLGSWSFTVTTVPEPASLGLGAAALVLLLSRRRRAA